MAKVTGGRLAVKALKKEGVKCVFTLCGGHIDPILQACLDEQVRVIDVRHEQAAAFAAEGWARATGKPGVALATAGPGVTNMITGMWNSFECLAPVILFGGRSPLAEFELGSLQDMDSLSLVQSVTKWRRPGYETKRIPEYVSMACRQAISGRPGPAYLEFPHDILAAEVDEEGVIFPVSYRTTARPQGEPGQIKEAVNLLLKAKKPVVIAGSGVWWSRAGAELREFIELVKLPLTLIQMARGAVPEDHPLCFGPTRVGTKESDVVLLIGTRLNYGLNFGRPGLFSGEGKWIQIDIEPEEIGRNRPIDIGIVGDAKAVLRQMIEEARDRCKGRQEPPWLEECRQYVSSRQKQLEVEMHSDSMPIHPARLCREIRDFIDRDATIVMDGGDATIWGAAVFKSYEPGHWLDNGPTGCLGVGVPFALAAKVARPDKQVLLLQGDGSFGLNGMEFDTMVRHNIPVVCVICNDEAWGMVLHGQLACGENRCVGSRLGFRPYHKMVEALGGYGEVVEKPAEIRPALQRAFASGLPACINVRCASIARGARR
ncbi:MAG: thiamine pyrophosphate-binding protein [Chloroflexota bacterium]